MTDLSTATAPFLSALRTLPLWLLGGLAAAGFAALYAPSFAGIDPAAFRAKWGIIAWLWAITFSILAVARGLDSSVSAFLSHRRSSQAHRTLRLVPLNRERWWHLARQRDDSFASQISLDVEVANLSDRPIRLVMVRLIRPKIKTLIHADALLPMDGSPYHSDKHPVPPGRSVTASLHIMVRGALAPQGRPIRVTVGITDQFGYEYRLKGIRISTHDQALTWTERLVYRLHRLPGLQPRPEPDPPPLPQWQHHGEFEPADLILKEERRSYAANGRERGGLGSLNVGLQSEPNSGWTEVGKVPVLLWQKSDAKAVDSEYLARLIKLHRTLDNSGKEALEQYLLSHLHKVSPYSDVAYFIFLALHRMGRTVDALQQARSFLAGDKVFGYSNLLGTLSAIVSREHFDMRDEDLSQIADLLAAGEEHHFRLIEKINLARVQRLDESTLRRR